MKILLSLLLLLAPVHSYPSDNEFDCLARNVYYEAGGEPRAGKLAVALVTLNRTEDKRYPKSICGVVFQKNQFSWTRNYKKVKLHPVQWQESKNAAFEAFMNRDILGKFAATHYHNMTVNPKWNLRKVAKIGGHVFFM